MAIVEILGQLLICFTATLCHQSFQVRTLVRSHAPNDILWVPVHYGLVVAPDLDRDDLAERLTGARTEGQVHLVDLSVNLCVGMHSQRVLEGRISVALDLSTHNKVVFDRKIFTARLLISKAEATACLVRQVGSVCDLNLNVLCLTSSQIDENLRLALDHRSLLGSKISLLRTLISFFILLYPFGTMPHRFLDFVIRLLVANNLLLLFNVDGLMSTSSHILLLLRLEGHIRPRLLRELLPINPLFALGTTLVACPFHHFLVLFIAGLASYL